MPPAGSLLTFQHKNRAIIVSKPPTNRARIEQASGKGGLHTLATVVDGKPASTELPLQLKAGQVLILKDGPSYLGIRPLPATDLGRGGDDILVASGGYGGQSEPNNAPIEPALTITSFNLKFKAPQPLEGLEWD